MKPDADVSDLTPFHPHWLDGLGPTPFGDLGFSIAIIVLVVLLLFFIASLIPMRLPGPLSDRERKASHLRSVLTIALRFVVGPGAIILGAFLTLLPYDYPRAIVLSSGVRSIDAKVWADRWDNRVSALLPDGQSAVDAGAIVRRIVDELALTPPSGGWNPDDETGCIAPLRQTVTRLLITEIEDLKDGSPTEVESAPEVRLPAWVTESVELAVLKGLIQRVNAGLIFVQYEPRETAIGPTWDEDIRQYLAASPVRASSPTLEFKSGGSPSSMRLLALTVEKPDAPATVTLELRRLPTDAFALDALTRVDVAPVDGARPVVRQLTGVAPRLGIQFAALDLVGIDAKEGIVVTHRPSGEQLVWKPAKVSGEPGDTSGLVRIEAADGPTSDRWEYTLNQLRSSPTFAHWRGQLACDHLAPLDEHAVKEAGARVIVHPFHDFVWVGRAQDEPYAQARPPNSLPTQLRATNGRGEASGVYDWAGLQLDRTPVIDRPDFYLGDVLTYSHEVQPELYGPALGGGPRGRALVATLPAIDSDKRPYVATIIALPPDDIGLLPPPGESPGPLFSYPNFLAFHRTLINAIHRAADGTPLVADTQSPATAAIPPLILLRQEELAEIRAIPLRNSASCMGWGFILYGVGTLAIVPFTSGQRARQPRRSPGAQ